MEISFYVFFDTQNHYLKPIIAYKQIASCLSEFEGCDFLDGVLAAALWIPDFLISQTFGFLFGLTVRDYGQTQHLPTYHQLRAGIRYLDYRYDILF